MRNIYAIILPNRQRVGAKALGAARVTNEKNEKIYIILGRGRKHCNVLIVRQRSKGYLVRYWRGTRANV